MLTDKVVLITGASGGLGSMVVREFAQTEARLVLCSTSRLRLEQLISEIGLSPERAYNIAADLTQADDVEEMLAAIEDRWGRPDVLLNTVGGWSGGKTVSETDEDDWRRMLALNLHSAFLLSRAVLPTMIEKGWGRIVHVSSKVALEARGKQVGYVVSKLGLLGLTEVIAAEVKGTGVTVNAILPSIIDTPANRKMMPKANPNKWVPPQHIAATMRFLCSEAGASINGTCLPIYAAV